KRSTVATGCFAVGGQQRGSPPGDHLRVRVVGFTLSTLFLGPGKKRGDSLRELALGRTPCCNRGYPRGTAAFRHRPDGNALMMACEARLQSRHREGDRFEFLGQCL